MATLPDDPLGYDTRDINRLARQMADDALASRNEDAGRAEVDRLSRLFPGKLKGDE